MRILQLTLNPYGCFGNLVVNFAEDRSFYVLYGPNEAGKSTVLRALVNLLYGIPRDTRDAHTYEAPTLRVGALIKASSGKQLEFLRRKGYKDTILDKRNNLPLADNVLDEYLSEATRELFTNMFAISHEKLLEGGKLLLSLEGDAGTSIFAAGAGLLELRNVLKKLDEKADQLFKPRGKDPFINSKISEFSKAKADISRYSVLPAKWQQLERQLDEKNAEQQNALRNLLKLQENKAQLERVKRVLPQLAVITEFESQLEKLGKFVMLPENAKNERLVASKQKMMAIDNINKANEDIKELKKQIENLKSPEGLLAQADTIIEIHKYIGKYRSARKDLPERYTKVEILEKDAANSLRKIDPWLTLDNAEQLGIPEDKAELIKNLVKERTAILSDIKNVASNLTSAESDQKAVAEDIDKIGKLADPTKLVNAIEAIKYQGDLESKLNTARTNIKTMKEDNLIQLKKLGLECTRIEEVEEFCVPLTETIEHYAKIFSDNAAEIKVVSQALETSREEERTVNAELERRQLFIGDIPTVDNLRDARRDRQEIWGTILLLLSTGEGATNGRSPVFSDQVLEQYEKSVDETDNIADRLYDNVEDVARKAQLISSKHEIENKLNDLRDKKESLEREFEKHELDWINIWKPIGISPKSAAEMRGWLAEYRKQEEYIGRIREEENNAKSLESMITKSRRLLNSLLEEIGELQGKEEESLSSILNRAACIIENIKAAIISQQSLLKQQDGIRNKIQSLRQQTEKLDDKLKTWQEKWGQAMELVHLEKNAIPEQAEIVLKNIDELFKKIDQLPEERIRISRMEATVKQFTDDVAGLKKVVAGDIAWMQDDQIIEELNARVGKAKEQEAALASTSRALDNRKRDLDGYLSQKEDAEKKLAELINYASCSDLDALMEIESKSEIARSVKDKLETAREQLLKNGDGLSIKEIAEEVSRFERDKLAGEIDEVEQNINANNDQVAQVTKEIWLIDQEMNEINTTNAANDAAELAQGALASLQNGVESYVQYRLAAAILRMQIDEYRRESQGPLLTKANKIFPRLTLGSFKSLTVDYDVNDKPVLLGVRPSGNTVSIGGMSDGALDQLYLSLRLASIDYHIEKGGDPMPFIVDDILINFDDDRAEETMKVLIEMSQNQQVLFFTHHKRLLELAEKVAPSGCLSTHILREASN